MAGFMILKKLMNYVFKKELWVSYLKEYSITKYIIDMLNSYFKS